MAEISAKVVMELRGRTGAGMMDCKKALTACDGDMDKAIDYLREKGLAAAAKKQSRIAAEGIVGAYICEKCGSGALVEVNCETDFVANTPEFRDMVQTIAQTIEEENPADVDALLACTAAGTDMTVSALITEKTAKVGEKISIRRFVRYDGKDGVVDSYIHMGGTVGVLLLAEGEPSDELKQVLHDVSLQIAAASPVAAEYVTRDQVTAEHLEHEREIRTAKYRNEGKPEAIIPRIVEGSMNSFYKEVCLMEQAFVKDPDVSVAQMMKAKAPGAKILAFTRYKMGDGLEKKVNDLAAEVAEQTKMKS